MSGDKHELQTDGVDNGDGLIDRSTCSDLRADDQLLDLTSGDSVADGLNAASSPTETAAGSSAEPSVGGPPVGWGVHPSTLGLSKKQTKGHPGGATGKGFYAGDPKRNTKGRPKSFDQLRALAQQIATEPALDAEGLPIVDQQGLVTKIEKMLRDMIASQVQSTAFIKIAYGEPPAETKHSGGVRIEVVYVDDKPSSSPPADSA